MLQSMGSQRVRHDLAELNWTQYHVKFRILIEKRCYPKNFSRGCSARSPNLWSGKKKTRDNATCNRGIYYWLEPGPPALTKGVRTKRPRAPVLSGIYWVQSDSWRKQIGYTVARQFLLAQSLWAFSFPLIGSLFLARHMLIGWLQVAW